MSLAQLKILGLDRSAEACEASSEISNQKIDKSDKERDLQRDSIKSTTSIESSASNPSETDVDSLIASAVNQTNQLQLNRRSRRLGSSAPVEHSPSCGNSSTHSGIIEPTTDSALLKPTPPGPSDFLANPCLEYLFHFRISSRQFSPCIVPIVGVQYFGCSLPFGPSENTVASELAAHSDNVNQVRDSESPREPGMV